jgi:hypothetical protein
MIGALLGYEGRSQLRPDSPGNVKRTQWSALTIVIFCFLFVNDSRKEVTNVLHF